MFKEPRGLEYALEILRALNNNPGVHDSKSIYELVVNGGRVTASLSYVQKILPRMAKIGLLVSSELGYTKPRPLDEITISEVLGICDMPDRDSALFILCEKLKAALSISSINEFYEF